MPDDRSTTADGPSAERSARSTSAGAGETLADLGEWELIRRLGAFAPEGRFSDDAALLEDVVTDPAAGAWQSGACKAPARQPGREDMTADGGGYSVCAGDGGSGNPAPGRRLVVNTDVLVEGLHFSEITTGPVDVGWRAAAANLSDLAAMGCTEVVGITVGLVAPASTPWSWVEGVYDGLAAALGRYGGELLGGDCSGGAQRMLAVTAIGRLPAPPATVRTLQDDEGTRANTGSRPWGVIRRGDGQPGDALICTGPHGLSRLGLALLKGEVPGSATFWTPPSDGPSTEPSPGTAAAPGSHPETCCGASGFDPGLRQRAIVAHRRPVPRFDAVQALIGCRPGGIAWRVGGCDSSDGLAAAVGAIAAASGCAARLQRHTLPLDPAMAGLAEAESWCLGGGEDFELVLALAPPWAEALLESLPGSSRIGELVEGEAGALGWSDGLAWSHGGAGSGYSHFR